MALRERVVAAAPSRNAALVLGGLLLALVVLTVLVAAGSFTRVDQFSVDHLMPWLRPGSSGPGGSAGYYRPFTLHTTTWSKLFDLWTYPCSVLISRARRHLGGGRPLAPLRAGRRRSRPPRRG